MDITNDLKKLVRVRKGQSANDVASSERMNAIQDLIRALCRGDNVMTGANTRLRRGEAFFTISADAVGASFSSSPYPFKVYSAAYPTGAPALRVYPGTIGRIIPKIFGIALDHKTLAGQFDALFSGPASDFSLLIKVSVDLTHGVNFRGGIVDPVEIVDSISESDFGIAGELAMIWDDDIARTEGHFYIKIADIKTSDDGAYSVKTQWLFQSYDSFVINDPDVIILQ